MKHILLIQPSFLQNNFSPPISLMQIASILRKNGFKPEIIDVNIETNYFKKIENIIKNKKPLAVGFSVMIGSQILSAKYLSQKIKKISKAKIIWGGSFPSAKPELIIKQQYIDFVIIGEGEQSILELINYLNESSSTQNSKKLTKLKRIKGIAYKINQTISINKQINNINLKQLPLPAWNIINIAKYDNLTLNVTRGCPFNCSFCTLSKNKIIRNKTAEQILNEIKVIQKLNPTKTLNLNFSDESFLLNRKRIKKLFFLAKKEKVSFKWSACMNIEYINEEYIDFLSMNGLNKILVGVEASSDNRRILLGKRFSNKELLYTIKLCTDKNIEFVSLFIIGLPNETYEEIKETLSFIDFLESKFKVHSRINQYKDLPGTKLSDKKLNKKRTLEDWAFVPFFIKKLNQNKNSNMYECIAYSLHYKNIKIVKENNSLSLTRLVIKFIANLRWKFKFFRFPIEIYLKKFLLIFKLLIIRVKSN